VVEERITFVDRQGLKFSLVKRIVTARIGTSSDAGHIGTLSWREKIIIKPLIASFRWANRIW